jgi:predicted unusual protein kinase regulating ubiquinone biosynthesis (AarF/ABC1/UbiB family)
LCVSYDRDRNAAQVYHLMGSLQGFWIKLGQYLSTRNDLMPEEYIAVLTKLQDRVKARPIDQVKKVIEEEFHRPCGEMFKSIDDKALAAASIAQVHRAVLHDGTVVAIKVQHRGMHDILMNDIINLEKLLSWISMVEPSADFKKALEEWGNEVLKELDFKNEASNLIEV